jgi:hypothetical protein
MVLDIILTIFLVIHIQGAEWSININPYTDQIELAYKNPFIIK